MMKDTICQPQRAGQEWMYKSMHRGGEADIDRLVLDTEDEARDYCYGWTCAVCDDNAELDGTSGWGRE